MSATRLLLFTTFPLRTHTHKPLSLITPLVLSQRLNFSSLRFHRYCSSVAVDTAAVGDTDSAKFPPHHPWPEWVSFVDRLKAKGYFEGENSSNDESANVYRDMNLVKDACLSFARDRYDVFKSLPVEDVQKVVEQGCPNLLRKAVNSAKRLRAYARLDEGDVCYYYYYFLFIALQCELKNGEVCSACTLRGSCDRAYVILKDSEVDARTVDIVRILLFYALDPLVISGGDKPAGRELVDLSVKKLFSELIKLSETAPDPSLPKPPSKPASKPAPKRVHRKEQINFVEDQLLQDIEMKRGDWMCPKCNFLNFARNAICLKCKEDGPKGTSGDHIEMKNGDWICSECSFVNFWKNIQCLKCKAKGPKMLAMKEVEMKKGDWNCPQCNFMNFSRNVQCLKCKAEGPKRPAMDEVEMKKGDWSCPQCFFMNFASNKNCLRCREPRPKRVLKPGDWECPSCDFINYGRNKFCLKCNSEPPKKDSTEYEEQIWRSPQ